MVFRPLLSMERHTAAPALATDSAELAAREEQRQ